VPFDRPHMISYSSIATVFLSYTVSAIIPTFKVILSSYQSPTFFPLSFTSPLHVIHLSSLGRLRTATWFTRLISRTKNIVLLLITF